MPKEEPKNLKKISLPGLLVRAGAEKSLEIKQIVPKTNIKGKTRITEAHLN